MGDRGRIVYDDQVGGHCCWLDAGDWWILCRTFLLLEVPIEQSMESFLGWVTGVVADLLVFLCRIDSTYVELILYDLIFSMCRINST
jgi:hypothetical protein